MECLKGDVVFYTKRCDLDNLQIIMTCILIHNICIHMNDPCKLRWRLEVNELNLIH